MPKINVLPILAFVITVMFPAAVFGQVPVEISSEKIISGGKTYYMHRIVKGQTLYSISRAYNVSIDEITRENNIQSGAIHPDQMLRIPLSETKVTILNDTRGLERSPGQGQSQGSDQPQPKAQPQPQSSPQIEVSDQKIVSGGKAFYVHEVKKGQTLYSISKAYKVTIDTINSVNVIPAYGIAPGQMLKIPASAALASAQPQAQAQAQPQAQTQAQPQAEPQPSASTVSVPPAAKEEPQAETEAQAKPEPQASGSKPAQKTSKTDQKRYHKVQKGESLSDIAKKYDVTVQELKQENKGLIFPTAGMRLVIPPAKENGTGSEEKR